MIILYLKIEKNQTIIRRREITQNCRSELGAFYANSLRKMGYTARQIILLFLCTEEVYLFVTSKSFIIIFVTLVHTVFGWWLYAQIFVHYFWFPESQLRHLLAGERVFEGMKTYMKAIGRIYLQLHAYRQFSTMTSKFLWDMTRKLQNEDSKREKRNLLLSGKIDNTSTALKQ